MDKLKKSIEQVKKDLEELDCLLNDCSDDEFLRFNIADLSDLQSYLKSLHWHLGHIEKYALFRVWELKKR